MLARSHDWRVCRSFEIFVWSPPLFYLSARNHDWRALYFLRIPVRFPIFSWDSSYRLLRVFCFSKPFNHRNALSPHSIHWLMIGAPGLFVEDRINVITRVWAPPLLEDRMGRFSTDSAYRCIVGCCWNAVVTIFCAGFGSLGFPYTWFDVERLNGAVHSPR